MGSNFPTFSLTLAIFLFYFYYGHPSRYERVPHSGFDLHFPSDVENCIMYLLTICISHLEKYLLKFFGLLAFLLLSGMPSGFEFLSSIDNHNLPEE